jgi:hypothetical protein
MKLGIKFRVILAVATLVGISFVFQPTVELQTDRQCQPDGWIASVREAVSSSRFWGLQTAALETEVKRLKTSVPNALRLSNEFALKSDAIIEKARQSMEKTYQKYPDLRPPAELKLADELREQADKIEHDAMMQRMHVYNLKRAADYQKCISEIDKS